MAIVVDPDFGQDLAPLARSMHVWIAGTRANLKVARQLWNDGMKGNNEMGLTTFTVPANYDGQQACVDVLPDVDLHHGAYSHEPPYEAVEVHGAGLSEAIQEAFRQYGLTTFETTAHGFCALRAKESRSNPSVEADTL